jgi:hypothetical protein
MPTVKVPLFSGVYKGADGIELSDDQAELMDAYLGELQQTVKRPGLTSLLTLDTGSAAVNGLYWWDEKSLAIITSNGRTYKITRTGSLSNPSFASTDLTGTSLTVGQTTFATDGTYIFMAAGGRIGYTDGTTTTALIADADAPTTVTHVGWLDGYVLANNLNNRFYWSDVNNSLSWGALNFASAEGASDSISALHVWDREIYLFGRRSLEIWENDGSTPFSRVSGGFKSSGCEAPYSIARTRTAAYWLNDERRFVSFVGRAIEPIAPGMNREVQRLAKVDDCIASTVLCDGYTFVIFNFPTANRTFVYNENNETWSEWGAFDSSTGLYDRFAAANIKYAQGWGMTLAGSNAGPLVFKLSSDVYSDASPIRVRRLTGLIDYGTLKLKRSNQLRLRVKRGQGL